ncbi:unnamed protein product [Aspergillus oryzae]|uniref:Unnamed protein product n=1 Tax=Aspergillus oryzae TaxID=5062 RepID=A0AAN4YEC8_ASPOZ|nr:unnamed protein product [Aspergillus oryzae]GMG28804.1 unnamed protein product [Aspergillus oryzae]
MQSTSAPPKGHVPLPHKGIQAHELHEDELTFGAPWSCLYEDTEGRTGHAPVGDIRIVHPLPGGVDRELAGHGNDGVPVAHEQNDLDPSGQALSRARQWSGDIRRIEACA